MQDRRAESVLTDEMKASQLQISCVATIKHDRGSEAETHKGALKHAGGRPAAASLSEDMLIAAFAGSLQSFRSLRTSSNHIDV